MSLLAAELTKLRTMRTIWAVTAIGWLLIGGVGTFLVLEEQLTGAFTGAESDVAALVAQIGGNSAIVLIVGLLLMTTEFRHGTIGRTLQLTPSRTRVLASKLLAGAVYALAFVVVGLVVVGALMLLAVVAKGASPELGTELLTSVWQGAAALVLTALLGVAVGSLLRSQVLAVAGALIWVFVVEPLVNVLLPDVGRWLPFEALNSVFMVEAMMGGAGTPLMDSSLSAPVALAVFLAWVAAAAVPAVILMRVRDV